MTNLNFDSGPVGRKIGPYRLIKKIGEGVIDVVYLARDSENRRVTIKVLRPAAAADLNALLRLAREVETLRRVRSRHVAQVLDADVQGPEPYIVTQYVPGETLEAWVRHNGPLRGAALDKFASSLAEALATIHSAGVIHRDLKAGNVVLDAGQPVIIDFGIEHDTATASLPGAGLVTGAPWFLAPEVIMGQPSSGASDVYSWGVTVAFAATGRQPFGTENDRALILRIVEGNADLTGLPPRLLPFITAALAADPRERPTAHWLAGRIAALGRNAEPAPELSVNAVASPVGLPVTPGNAAVIEVAIRRDHLRGMFGVEVVSSPAGEATTTVSLDVDDLLARRESLQWAVLASTVASRRVLRATERPVVEIGKRLFAALLGAGEVSGRYRAAAAVAAERGQRLRVVLRIDAPELAALPWEAMYDEAAGAYVCRQDQLVRHVGVQSMPAPLPVRPPLRILGIAASPRELPGLDVKKEQDHLARALERSVSQGTVEVHWAQAATWAQVHGMLLDGPWHVVHFIGHGDFDPVHDEGFLIFVDDYGHAHRVAAHRMVDLLRQGNPQPRLVVLNACAGAQGSPNDLFSGTAAALVRGGISAVAAMQYEISDAAAIAFAYGFYTAIAHGRGIDEALSSGRVAILGTSDHTLEWLTPVLYLRGRETNLFAVR